MPLLKLRGSKGVGVTGEGYKRDALRAYRGSGRIEKLNPLSRSPATAFYPQRRLGMRPWGVPRRFPHLHGGSAALRVFLLPSPTLLDGDGNVNALEAFLPPPPPIGGGEHNPQGTTAAVLTSHSGGGFFKKPIHLHAITQGYFPTSRHDA